jgi:hypothetical protein
MRQTTLRRAAITTTAIALGLGPMLAAVPPARAQQAATQQPTTPDDAPSPAERARIEAVLRERGFVRWKEIEREDGGRTWEVDDAYTAEGRRYDLRLSADDLREIARQDEN